MVSDPAVVSDVTVFAADTSKVGWSPSTMVPVALGTWLAINVYPVPGRRVSVTDSASSRAVSARAETLMVLVVSAAANAMVPGKLV